MSLTVGIGGVRRNACAAVADAQQKQLIGVCEQERVTRVRAAGVNTTGLPDEALDAILDRHGRTRGDIGSIVVAEDPRVSLPAGVAHVEHHYAHACASYLTSGYESATILVCDHEEPKISVWKGANGSVTRVEWPWTGIGFSDLYTASAKALGFNSAAGDQHFGVIARHVATPAESPLKSLFATDGTRLIVQAGWEGVAADALRQSSPRSDTESRARIAAALESRIGEVFLEFLAELRRRCGGDALCLGGSFFYHSSINSRARNSGLFSKVFVPIDPGNAGLAVGSALQAVGAAPGRISPFLGPAYEPHEIKAILDNCKLPYAWADEGEVVSIVVEALQHGRLVGWLEGGMEWGPRALGGRSILANPFKPFVLENLNTFLKRRAPWRGYALSALESATTEHFVGPAESPFMECDYRPRDPSTFRHVLPSPEAALRVHTASEATAPARFRALLKAFGETAGIPCLVNTSFNGFHEPIVCTPRDAVRVFFGSGLDVLILDRFVVTK